MKNYRNLKIWQRGHVLTVMVYQKTKTYPKDEVFGLMSQMRRACVSIPGNIAEGCGREGDAELRRFLTIAMGSAFELDYYILLSCELGYLDATASRELGAEILEIRSMLATFIRRLRA